MTIITGGVVITGFTQFTANYVPEPPTVLTATWTTTVTNTVSLKFTAPANSGSGPVLSYSAASNPAGFTATIAASTNTFVIPGLSSSTYYVFNIYATNFAGNSPLSTASNVVYGLYSSPILLSSYSVPPAPTSISAIVTASNVSSTPSALVRFLPGDSTIPATSYTVLANGDVAGVGTAIPTPSYSGSFNGSSSWISFSTNPNPIVGTVDFTIEMWVYPLDTTNGSMVGNWTQNGGGDHGMKISYGRTVAGKFEFFYSSSGQSSPGVMVSANTYVANAWYHVAAVRVGSIVTLYVNGTSAVSGTYSNDMYEQNFWIGTENNGYNTTWFNGFISNLRIVRYLAVYTGNFTPPTGPLALTQSAGTNISALTVANTVTMLTLQNATSIVDNSSFVRSLTVSSVTTSTNQPFDSYASVTVSNLSPTTSYTFRAYASNLVGNSGLSNTSSAITTLVASSAAAYTFPGSYTWVAPANVTSVSVVAVGGGGGTYTRGSGSESYFNINTLVSGKGGSSGSFSPGAGGSYVGTGGGNGGTSCRGGGGAGGYSGSGGSGGSAVGVAGAGGGGGGGAKGATCYGGGGGGVGLFGLGANGAAGVTNTITGYGSAGAAGSYGLSGGCGTTTGRGGLFGGGQGGYYSSYGYTGGGGGGLGYVNSTTVIPGTSYTVQVGTGGGTACLGMGCGAVRIVWPGQIRAFPSRAVFCYTNSTASQFVPNAPTSVTAAALSGTHVIVAFTAPTYIGGSAITSYTAISSPGNIAITTSTVAASGVVVVGGLTPLTSYTFQVYATNSYGTGTGAISASTSTFVAAGSALYYFPGTYSWVVPANVKSVSALAVGAGGGGLAATVLVSTSAAKDGGQSYFGNTGILFAGGGGGTFFRCGGATNYGSGGDGGGLAGVVFYSGGIPSYRYGGGAAGYTGNGGGSAGPASGGAGGRGACLALNRAGGGGVGLFGLGATGSAGSTNGICSIYGQGGSGGIAASICGGGVFGGGGAGTVGSGSNYGGGGGGGGLAYLNNYAVTSGTSFTVVVGAGGTYTGGAGSAANIGGVGAIRIVWPGQVRSFPSTGVNEGWGSDSATIASTYVPNAPTVSTISATSATAIIIGYTASTINGASPITSYTAVSSNGLYSATTATAGSGAIMVHGLSQLTSYSFSVYATNSYGNSAVSSSLTTTTYVASSSTLFTMPGSYTWIAPPNVTSVSALVVGGGAAGQVYLCSAYQSASGGGQSSFYNNAVVAANGGGQNSGGSVAAGTGFAGGAGGGVANIGGCGVYGNGGGGGAAGYTAAGGAGAGSNSSSNGTASTGGGGGGGSNAYGNPNFPSGGGGVGLFGLGANGTGGVLNFSTGLGSAGGGGSGGLSGMDHGPSGQVYSGSGGLFGGGGGGAGWGSPRNTSVTGGGGGGLSYINNLTVVPGNSYAVVVGAGGTSAASPTSGGAGGAVRIVWPGSIRRFPSTNVNEGWGFDPATLASTYVPPTLTIVTATAVSTSSINVSWVAPRSTIGVRTDVITAYTTVGVTCGRTFTVNTAGSYFVSISGLTALTQYSFYVYATNQYGNSTGSNFVSTTTFAPPGEVIYSTAGTFSWVVPASITSVSVVAVGGGGTGRMKCAGQASGAASSFALASPSTTYVSAGGGAGGSYGATGGAGGTVATGTGFAGGAGGGGNGCQQGGGGGAGGYTAAGGVGGFGGGAAGAASTGGGGGGGTGNGQGGGGVGLFGLGSNGSAGGGGGSGGGSGGSQTSGTGGSGGLYGGGTGASVIGGGAMAGGGAGALAYANNITVTPGITYTVVVGAGGVTAGDPTSSGGRGAVRIIWPGTSRQFPSTLTTTL